MATIVIENVPDLIVKKYWNKIQYSNEIKFPRHKRVNNMFDIDEKVFDDAVKSDKIRKKMSILASKI